MARRKKGESALDAWADLVARLPWWVGVLLAMASYVGLGRVASSSLTAASDIGQLSSVVTQSLWIGLASVGQYLAPFVCLVGAALSWLRRRRAGQLHADAIQRSDGMAQMSWREFEVLVAEHFRRQGFAVTEAGGGGPDGGVDVHIRRGSDHYLVQCKHWRARRVGVEPVRELYGLIAAQRMAGGYVVTSGDFTDEARRFASGREIQLINGRDLRRGLRVGASDPAAARAYAPTEPMGLVPALASTARESHGPCPLCGATMVLREVRTGVHAGTAFWGCSQFARTGCRGTRPVQP